MITFTLTDPDSLPFEALTWLKVSVNKTPDNDTNLFEIMDRARQGEGSFYLVKSDDIPVGAIYLEWLPWCLNIVLLGGDYIKDWRSEFHDFCVRLMRERGIKTLMFIGRYGMGKVFPELKSIGMLYTFEDK